MPKPCFAWIRMAAEQNFWVTEGIETFFLNLCYSCLEVDSVTNSKEIATGVIFPTFHL